MSQLQNIYNNVVAHAIKGNLVSKKSNKQRCSRKDKKIYLSPNGAFYYICRGKKKYIRSEAFKRQLAQTGQFYSDKQDRKSARLELLDYNFPKAKLKRMNLAEMLYTLEQLRKGDV